VTEGTVRSNVYSGEHKVRQDLTDILTEHEYGVDSYVITDKDGKRVIAVKATKDLEQTQSTLKFNRDPSQHPDEV